MSATMSKSVEPTRMSMISVLRTMLSRMIQCGLVDLWVRMYVDLEVLVGDNCVMSTYLYWMVIFKVHGRLGSFAGGLQMVAGSDYAW